MNLPMTQLLLDLQCLLGTGGDGAEFPQNVPSLGVMGLQEAGLRESQTHS